MNSVNTTLYLSFHFYLFFCCLSDTPTKEIIGQKISSDSDIFTDFLNAAPNNSTSEMKSDSNNLSSSGASLSRTEEEESFFNQSVSSASNKQKQLTKDSILALYGKVFVRENISEFKLFP